MSDKVGLFQWPQCGGWPLFRNREYKRKGRRDSRKDEEIETLCIVCLLVGQVSWAYELRFKRYFRNCTLPCTILTYTQRDVAIFKLIEWFKIKEIEYLKKGIWLFINCVSKTTFSEVIIFLGGKL